MESSNGTYKNTVQITNGDVIIIIYNTLRKSCFELKVQNNFMISQSYFHLLKYWSNFPNYVAARLNWNQNQTELLFAL